MFPVYTCLPSTKFHMLFTVLITLLYKLKNYYLFLEACWPYLSSWQASTPCCLVCMRAFCFYHHYGF